MSDSHSHSHAPAAPQVELPWQKGGHAGPIALSPLTEAHLKAGATLEVVSGWCVATRYDAAPGVGGEGDSTGAGGRSEAKPPAAETSRLALGNTVVDISHRAKQELVGRDVTSRLKAATGTDVPLRTIRVQGGAEVYRLTSQRAVIFGVLPPIAGSLPATGAWASISLIGPDRERILNKITAVDLRERTLPVDGCCQGPIFGVNTLFGRRADRFDLHVPADSAEFFWEVLLDAGKAFGLQATGSVTGAK